MKGHLRERSPGRWAIILDIKDDTSGIRKRKWHKFKGTKREAQVECARLISQMQPGLYTEPTKLTVGQFVEQWLEHIRSQVAPRTHERYAELARKHLVPMLGKVLLGKLNPMQISSSYSTALASGRIDGSGGLSPRTVHHLHRVLNQALVQAVKWGILPRNPCDAVDPPRVERGIMATYDLGQSARVLEAMRGTRMFIPTLLALLCGLRRGEIAALRWRSVDLNRAELAVVESVEHTGAGIRYKEPKSGRGRSVALPSIVIEELRAHRVEQAQELFKLGVRVTDESFTVCQADGRPMQPTFITHAWIKLIKRSGLPPLRFDDLRHAHATHLLGSGVHPKVASERLGHSKVGITLDLYSHVLPGMQADAAALVDQAFRTAKEEA